jgi:hypothetical protein
MKTNAWRRIFHTRLSGMITKTVIDKIFVSTSNLPVLGSFFFCVLAPNELTSIILSDIVMQQKEITFLE